MLTSTEEEHLEISHLSVKVIIGLRGENEVIVYSLSVGHREDYIIVTWQEKIGILTRKLKVSVEPLLLKGLVFHLSPLS